MEKVIVSRERIDKIAEFINYNVSNCADCPAFDECRELGEMDCRVPIVNYLLGMKFGKYEAKKREGTYNDIVGISQWVIGFKNGYEASIITGKYTHTNKEYPYELAVLKNGEVCYDTPITDSVIGHLTADEVGKILAKIEALPDA